MTERTLKVLYFVGLPLALAVLSVIGSFLLIEKVAPLNDLFSNQLRPVAKNIPTGAGDVVLVLSDSATPQELGEDESTTIVPRRHHAKLLNLLDKASVKGVVFDYIFEDSYPENDAEVQQALKDTNIPWIIFAAGTTTQDEAEIESLGGDKSLGKLPITKPIFGNFDSTPWIGSGFSLKDGNEELFAIHPVQFDLNSRQSVYHLGYLAAMLARGEQPGTLATKIIHSAEAGAPANNAIRVPCKDLGSFQHLRYADALKVLEAGTFGRFKDKIVIVGRVDDPADFHKVRGQRTVPGIVFVASVVSFLTSYQQYSSTSVLPAILIAIIFGFCGSLIVITTGEARKVTFLGVALLALFAFLSGPTLSYRGETVLWLFSLVLGITLASLLFSAVKRRSDFRVASQSETASVMFLDVIGSTGLVSKIGAQQYQLKMSVLNRLCSEAILKNSGLLERTTGDGFIAVFRGQSGEIATRHAIKCARDLWFSLSNAPGLPPCSIGIETGEISGGYVFEGGHRLWSSSGLTVVLAQRIQSMGAKLGVFCAFGPSAKELIGMVEVGSLGSHPLKGVEQDVEIWELKM